MLYRFISAVNCEHQQKLMLATVMLHLQDFLHISWPPHSQFLSAVGSHITSWTAEFVFLSNFQLQTSVGRESFIMREQNQDIREFLILTICSE